jgi:hypothetical protein
MLAIVDQVHVAQQRISLTDHIFLLNLPAHLDPKGRTMDGLSIVSASQIMVKRQGLKHQQKQTNHGAHHEMVKLWCIGTDAGRFLFLFKQMWGRFMFFIHDVARTECEVLQYSCTWKRAPGETLKSRFQKVKFYDKNVDIMSFVLAF